MKNKQQQIEKAHNERRRKNKYNNDKLTVALGAFATFEIDIEDYFLVTGKGRARKTRRTPRYL